MNPYRSTEENMSALKKVLTQRTLVAIANVAARARWQTARVPCQI